MDKLELLHRVRNYVTHAKKIHQSTKYKYQMSMDYAEKLDNLQFCKSVLADKLEYKTKLQVAFRIKSIRNQLHNILPNGNNPSYYSSLKVYQEIINECLAEINANGNN